MGPPVGKTRIKKTPEQVAILKAIYDAGMTSTHDKEKIKEARIKTQLPESSIKDWINNQRKPNRGSIKKRTSNFNIYTAYMALPCTDFNPDVDNLGDLTKERAKAYQDLKKTKEGMKFLVENMKKMNNLKGPELTETQRRGRALGIYGKIKKQNDKLQDLGYSATTLILHPDGRHTVLGIPKAVYFFRNNEAIVDDFRQYISDGEGQATSDTRFVLQQKVQDLFNNAYSQAAGLERAAMPYTAIKAGLDVQVTGFPEGIIFKKPSSYGIGDMQAILDTEHTIKVSIGSGTPNVNSDTPSEETTTSTPELSDDLPLEGVVTIAVEQESSSGSSQGIGTPTVAQALPQDPHPPIFIQAVTCEPPQRVDVPMVIEQDVTGDPQPNGTVPVAIEPDDYLELSEEAQILFAPVVGNEIGTEANVVSLDQTPLMEAMALAQEEVNHVQPESKLKRISRRGDRMLGKKIKHLWRMQNGELEWYDGEIQSRSGDTYKVLYDDKSTSDVSTSDFKKYRRNKTIIVLKKLK